MAAVMTKTIGVIGLGSIGMRHAKNLCDMGHHVWGYDPDKGRQKEWGGAIVLDNEEDIYHMGAGAIDAVVIANPTRDHLNSIHRAVEHRRHFFVEKPVGNFWNPEIIRIANEKHLVNMVGYNLRNHSCVKKAKEWLDAGLIGDPIWANFTLGQYSEKPPYLRDGVILNWSHEIDLALYLLGPAKVTGSSTRITNSNDEMTDILLSHDELSSGVYKRCRSTVHLDYITKPEQRYFTIAGAEATIHVDLVKRVAWINTEKEENPYFRGFDTWNDNYIEEMQAFIDRIDGKEAIGCTGEEALKVLEVCLEVRKQAGLS